MRIRSLPSILLAVCLAVSCGGHTQTRPLKEGGLYHYRKGLLAFEQNRFAEGIKEVDEAVRIEPANAGYRYKLGEFHFRLGEMEAAEAGLREALKLDPYMSDARNMLGAVLSEKGRREDALKEFQTVLGDKNYATPEKVWVNIALLYDQMGDADEAVRSYRRAIDNNPHYGRAHYGLAQVLDKVGRLEEAIAEYTVALADYDSSPEFHYQLGLACFRAGKKEQAREHLETVSRQAPGSTDAARAEELLKLIR